MRSRPRRYEDGEVSLPKVGIFRSSGANSNTSFSNTIFNPKTKFFDRLDNATNHRKKLIKPDPNFFANQSLTTQSTKNFFTHSNFNMTKTELGDPYPSSLEINTKKNKDISDKIKMATTEPVENIPKYNLNSHYRNDSPFSNKFRITKNVYNNLSHIQPENQFYLTQHFKPGNLENSTSTNLFPGVEIMDDKSEREVIEATLDQSTDSITPIDCIEEEKLTMGTAAVTDFYGHHKMLDKAIDQNKFMKQGSSVYTSMLQKSSQNFLLPNKLGVIRAHGEKKLLNCRNFMIGNKYAKVLSEGINTIDFETVDLTNNRLDEIGAKTVIGHLRASNKTINFSRNRIGKSISLLEPIILHKDSKLQHLDLSKNKIGNRAAISLVSTLSQNKNLETLNLSENVLSDNICESLADLIYHHSELKELYLRWNGISYKGAKKIFKRLAKGSNQT